ncbi:hypothetical protein PAXRUDRAFT_618540 [Paxillus rubicundulus Ve08.2h10]|uniref:Unplaced genomic scaffold scaffold_54, whole genome shotgun sequence n=1 Tax=Paxillus rubicundulus Ve08.2h10 TaxID=930991 RepID=A0A0D0EC81_9AGAM|nr:hypothetical protein PAXRUDRAFT_618540 [Paxillus rubicundulus Ve08.2h10]
MFWGEHLLCPRPSPQEKDFVSDGVYPRRLRPVPLNLGDVVVGFEKDFLAHPYDRSLGLGCDADRIEAAETVSDSQVASASANNGVCEAVDCGCHVLCPCHHHCTFVGVTESARVSVFVCGLGESVGGIGSHREKG